MDEEVELNERVFGGGALLSPQSRQGAKLFYKERVKGGKHGLSEHLMRTKLKERLALDP